jgi:hypothetical protein
MTSPDMSDPFALRSWSANLIHADDDDLSRHDALPHDV